MSMETAAKHAADVGAAMMAAASLVLWGVQQASPVLASLTTLMAFLWWGRKWMRDLRRWWRDRRGRRDLP